MAARSKAWFCSNTPAGIIGSIPTKGIDVCLLWVLYAVSYIGLGWSLVQRSPTECDASLCVI